MTIHMIESYQDAQGNHGDQGRMRHIGQLPVVVLVMASPLHRIEAVWQFSNELICYWLQQLARCIDCSGYLRAIATGNYRAQGGQPAKTLSGKAESKFFRLESVHQAVVRDVNSHDSFNS